MYDLFFHFTMYSISLEPSSANANPQQRIKHMVSEGICFSVSSRVHACAQRLGWPRQCRASPFSRTYLFDAIRRKHAEIGVQCEQVCHMHTPVAATVVGEAGKLKPPNTGRLGASVGLALAGDDAGASTSRYPRSVCFLGCRRPRIFSIWLLSSSDKGSGTTGSAVTCPLARAAQAGQALTLPASVASPRSFTVLNTHLTWTKLRSTQQVPT